MAQSKLTGKGGPNRGQGRHRLSKDEPTVENTITWPESYSEWAKKLGGGEVSKGVRVLVEFYLAHQPRA